jgi:hypothetical protein
VIGDIMCGIAFDESLTRGCGMILRLCRELEDVALTSGTGKVKTNDQSE